MVLEHVILPVRAGQEREFELALEQALPIIKRQPGFGGLEIRPSLDQPGQYLLLVHWESVAAHRDGFRQSADYQQWSALLHPFYDPMPVVGYFGEAL
jgi:heme-degrading monooxygenase HmoA